MARTPDEVVQHHFKALGDGDLEEIMTDYAVDAVLVTAAGVVRGRDAIRAGFGQLLTTMPNIAWASSAQVSAGDTVLLEWTADAGTVAVDDGVDTFVVRDGLIQSQTARSSWRAAAQ
jgi:ketosteroid isomerase-like protein